MAMSISYSRQKRDTKDDEIENGMQVDGCRPCRGPCKGSKNKEKKNVAQLLSKILSAQVAQPCRPYMPYSLIIWLLGAKTLPRWQRGLAPRTSSAGTRAPALHWAPRQTGIPGASIAGPRPQPQGTRANNPPHLPAETLLFFSGCNSAGSTTTTP